MTAGKQGCETGFCGNLGAFTCLWERVEMGAREIDGLADANATTVLIVSVRASHTCKEEMSSQVQDFFIYRGSTPAPPFTELRVRNHENMRESFQGSYFQS